MKDLWIVRAEFEDGGDATVCQVTYADGSTEILRSEEELKRLQERIHMQIEASNILDT